MKNKETVYKNEDTMLDETRSNAQVSPDQKTNVENNTSGDTKNTSEFRKSATGLGIGVLLGGISTLIFTSATSAETDLENESGEDTGGSESPAWVDGDVKVATGVSEEMTFSQAFGTARAEVGPGGAFEWHGNVYSTYTAEEWENMSTEERGEYNGHFSWSNHEGSSNGEIVDENGTPLVEPEADAVDAGLTDEDGAEGSTDEDGTEESTDENVVVVVEDSIDDVIEVDEVSSDGVSDSAGQFIEQVQEPESIEIIEEDGIIDIDNDPDIDIIDSDIVDPATAEVEILGVEFDGDSGSDIGNVMVGGQEVILVDVDGSGTFDYVATDLDGDGQIADDELADIADENLTSDLFDNPSEDHSMLDLNEDDIDYTNDAFVL